MMGNATRSEYDCTNCGHHFTTHGSLMDSPEGHWYTGGACKEECFCKKYSNKPQQILKVQVQTLTAKLPTRAYENDACYDLYADEEVIITNTPTKVNMGIRIAIPVGYEGVVRSRSSSFAKKNLHVFVGTIDSGYRGDVLCIVNTVEAETWYKVEKGEAICQIALRKVPAFTVLEVVELPESQRGVKGWGSSG